MTETLTKSDDEIGENPDPASGAQGDVSNASERTSSKHVTVIKPRSDWQLLDWNEMVEFRDLFRFLVWRIIKVRYAQSVLGLGWTMIQPIATMLVFTVVFGGLANISSDGVPYAIFSFVALVPWTYFSNALTEGVNSLVQNANMLSKIYFPRILLPFSAVFAKLLDFMIAFVVLIGLMIWYGVVPTVQVFWIPLMVFFVVLTAAGFATWLTALAIQYRDVNYGMTFCVQLLMYASPVVYPTSLVPREYQLIYALNPMVGVIEGFRASLLDTRPMPWDLLAVGGVTAVTLFITGMLYFRRREPVFADVA